MAGRFACISIDNSVFVCVRVRAVNQTFACVNHLSLSPLISVI